MEQSSPTTPETTDSHSSVIHAEFKEPGSAQFSIATNSVSPIQMLALAEWLRWRAWSDMSRSEEATDAISIARSLPTPNIRRKQ